jgi:hypothetical protein
VRQEEVDAALAMGVRQVLWKPMTFGELAEPLCRLTVARVPKSGVNRELENRQL